MPGVLDNKQLLKEAIDSSSSIKETLHKLGLRSAGGNYANFHKACEKFSLEVPKYNFSSIKNAKTNDEVFVINSTYNNRTLLKKRLFGLGVKNECKCGQGPEWKGKPLTLTLEHKNGIWNDNRLENLEILCPNCHAQTETFSGKKTRLEKKHCPDCDKIIARTSLKCSSCASKERNGNTYPETKKLIAKIKQNGYTQVAKEIGVSDNAIRKHLQKLNINPKTFI